LQVWAALCGREVDHSRPVDGAVDGISGVGKRRHTEEGRFDVVGVLADKEDLLIVFRSVFGVGPFLVIVPGQAFPQAAAAAAMHFRIESVLAKIFGDIIPVGVEFGDDSNPAEGRSHKGQEQYEGCALSPHCRVKFWQR
jgi:hypothetical protein